MLCQIGYSRWALGSQEVAWPELIESGDCYLRTNLGTLETAV